MGSDSAYVGFSAATGSGAAAQTVSDFNFQFDSATHWAGAPGADWTTANDWTDGNSNVVTTPNSTNAVFIDGSGFYTLEITSADTAGSLTITSAGAGADVQDESGGSLSVTGALTIDAGSFSLIGGNLTAASIYVGGAGHFIGEGAVSAPLNNDGGFVEAYGNLTLSGAVTGAGTFQIDNGNTLEFGSTVASGTNISFTGTTGDLKLDAPAGADLNISGFAGTSPDAGHSDEVQLAGVWSIQSETTTSGGNVVLDLQSGDETVALWFESPGGALNVSNDGTNTYVFDPPAKPVGAIVSPDSDTFVFHSDMGAETISNFNPEADTIELDNFNNIHSVHQLAALITTDAQGDAVIGLGHHDSITLPGVSANYLQAHLHSLVHLG